MSLTLAEAERMLQAAKAKALEMEIKVAIAIVDARGDLITMARLDDALWITTDVARAKAFGSATYRIPSSQLKDRPIQFVISVANMLGGHIVFWQGALPIFRDGKLIGAIGASGSASENDEAVAQAGLDAL